MSIDDVLAGLELPEPPRVDPARLVPGGSFIFDEPDTVPVLWGTGDQVLWAAGESMFVVGPQGVGKTSVVNQLVLARIGVRDPELLGYPVVVSDDPVLYLAADRPRQVARSLRRMVDPDDRDRLNERLTVWKGPPPVDLARDPNLLVDMAAACQAGAVVLDSLKDLAIGLSDDETGAGVNRAIQTALVAGVEVIPLHHQRKAGANGGKPKSMSDVYGSTWLTAGAGSVLLLWGEPGDLVVTLHHLKQPADDIGPLSLIHDHDTGTTTLVDQLDLVGLASRAPNGITAADAARALFGTQDPERNQTEKARRRLDRLAKAGELQLEPGNPAGSNPTPNRYRRPTILEL